MKIKIGLFAALTAVLVFLSGQDGIASPGIDVDLDYALFKFNQDTVYWEIYYDIHEGTLKLKKQPSGKFLAEALVRLTIAKDGAPWYSNQWRVQDVHPDSNAVGKGILDRVKMLAVPGKYRMQLFVQDLNQKTNSDSVSQELQIKPFSSNQLALSNIEMASFIRQAPNEEQNPFYRNSLIIKPNPSGLFGPVAPALFFYVEAYNLKSQIRGNSYRIRYYVTDMNDKPDTLVKSTEYEKKKEYDSTVEIGRINVMALNPGAYYLVCNLIDPETQKTVTRKKKFFVYKNNYRPSKRSIEFEKLFQKSVFAQMTEPEVDQQFEYASYVMTKDRKKIYKGLKKLALKRRFMFAFWYSVDPTKGTARNERYEEYQKRIKYANEHFRAFKKEGWKTDRGRVYIVYGPPTNIERFPYNGSRKPYQIWHYNELQGGVIFVFADLNGLKDYRLLHSTLKGEVYNPDYMKIISEF